MAVGPRESLSEAAAESLVDLAGRHPTLAVYEAQSDPTDPAMRFSERFPNRLHRATATESAAELARHHAAAGHPAVLLASPAGIVPHLELVARAAADTSGSLVVLLEPARETSPSRDVLRWVEAFDVELVRNVPRLQVLVPADAASTRSVLRAAPSFPGATVVRLPSGPQPALGGPPFELGRARLLQEGNDLTMVANGPAVAIALEATEELGRVGIHARVLDLASVKPFDVKAIVRAARETGALLCLESQNLFSGLGSLVAATTSASEPVPVRRVGAPDLWDPAPTGEGSWLTKERALEEAYELLRAKGKVQ